MCDKHSAPMGHHLEHPQVDKPQQRGHRIAVCCVSHPMRHGVRCMACLCAVCHMQWMRPEGRRCCESPSHCTHHPATSTAREQPGDGDDAARARSAARPRHVHPALPFRRATAGTWDLISSENRLGTPALAVTLARHAHWQVRARTHARVGAQAHSHTHADTIRTGVHARVGVQTCTGMLARARRYIGAQIRVHARARCPRFRSANRVHTRTHA
jgi:hypothetical protein